MAVDKSRTPVWVKAIIWVVAASFVFGGVAVVGFGGGSSSNSSGTGTTTGGITAQYQPAVDAAVAAVNASPENPDLLAMAGHRYYEWAVALYESNQQSASVPLWLAAVAYYDRALAIRPDDVIVLGNKAFALSYANDAGAADALRAFIAADTTNSTGQVPSAEQLLADIVTSSSVTTTESATTTTP